MADAVQTSIPSTEAAPAAAPAVAPAVEAAKPADTGVDVAQFKALEKTAAKLAKELEATKAKAAEADGMREALAAALGVGKKADPMEEVAKLREANDRLSKGIRRSAVMEAVRAAAKDAHDPSDLLAFLDLSDVDVDLESASVRNVDVIAERIGAAREKRPYLFQQAQKSAGPGLPVAPVQIAAPPVTKTEAPNRPVTRTGPGVFGRG